MEPFIERSQFRVRPCFARSLVISAPQVMVTHSVSSSDQLTAELAWTNGVRVEGWTEPLVTADITTQIEIWRIRPHLSTKSTRT